MSAIAAIVFIGGMLVVLAADQRTDGERSGKFGVLRHAVSSWVKPRLDRRPQAPVAPDQATSTRMTSLSSSAVTRTTSTSVMATPSRAAAGTSLTSIRPEAATR